MLVIEMPNRAREEKHFVSIRPREYFLANLVRVCGDDPGRMVVAHVCVRLDCYCSLVEPLDVLYGQARHLCEAKLQANNELACKPLASQRRCHRSLQLA